MNKNKTAVVDIDGILWNMAEFWYDELIKINPACPYPGSTSAWCFHKGYMSDEEFQKTIDIVHMKQEHFPAFKEAYKLPNMLYSAGFRVNIASHRTALSKTTTANWLYKNSIYYDELHTVSDKHFLLKDADLFIDDSPTSQKYAINNHIPVLSLKYLYNEHVKGVLFFDTFSEMLGGLEKWLDDFKYTQGPHVSIKK